jgi:2Fe-2S ferredoxin
MLSSCRDKNCDETSVVNLITVLVEPTGSKINVRPGISLLEAARKAGVTIRSECGGKVACGKCLVIIPDKNAVTRTIED